MQVKRVKHSLPISIHTPVQGVTSPSEWCHHHTGYFNPHSCARSDQDVEICFVLLAYFNPHSCVRSDQKPTHLIGDVWLISIRTPV